MQLDNPINETMPCILVEKMASLLIATPPLPEGLALCSIYDAGKLGNVP